MPLTREALDQKVNPPVENRCGVKLLSDTLDPDKQQVLNDALALDPRVLSADGLRALLRDDEDVRAELVPSIDQIHNHRSAQPRGACKCPR